MLKGTPLGSLLDAIGGLYWFVHFAAIVVVLVRAQSRRARLVGLAWVLGLLVLPMLLIAVPMAIERSRAQARFNDSYALFKQHCKSAGEKVHKTVDNVDGVVWMKWRPTSADPYDQFALDDPFGHDCSGDDCILQLLRVSSGTERHPVAAGRHRGRYQFVESVDPLGGRLHRYTAVIKAVRQRTPEQIEAYKRNTKGIDPGPGIWDLALEREPIEKPTARYGITWDDLSTREDREHWIAGSSLKVIDLQTQEVIAERIGYMMDAGQGNTSGGRQPWSHANYSACPAKRDSSGKETRIGFTNRFVESVLHPGTGSSK